MPTPIDTPAWTQFKDVSKDDVLAMEAADCAFNTSLPERVLTHLKQLEAWSAQAACLPISRYAHCLQSATLAYRAERYDQAAFHPQAEILPLEFFEPMLRTIFSRTPNWMHEQDGLASGTAAQAVRLG